MTQRRRVNLLVCQPVARTSIPAAVQATWTPPATSFSTRRCASATDAAVFWATRTATSWSGRPAPFLQRSGAEWWPGRTRPCPWRAGSVGVLDTAAACGVRDGKFPHSQGRHRDHGPCDRGARSRRVGHNWKPAQPMRKHCPVQYVARPIPGRRLRDGIHQLTGGSGTSPLTCATHDPRRTFSSPSSRDTIHERDAPHHH